MGELSAALRGIERRHNEYHWHCYSSDRGRLWAVTTFCAERLGSGTTVGGIGSTEVLERQIAEIEHRWELAGVAA